MVSMISTHSSNMVNRSLLRIPRRNMVNRSLLRIPRRASSITSSMVNRSLAALFDWRACVLLLTSTPAYLSS